MRLYGSWEGFKYCFTPKPLLGAYVAMETFARGLLDYGDFDEYHAYYRKDSLTRLTPDEIKKAYFQWGTLKVMPVSALLAHPDRPYAVFHFEMLSPPEEVVLRHILSRGNVPITRRAYTIATNGHLRQYLDLCLLGGGGRPYDSIVVPSHPTRAVLLAYFADVSAATSGRLQYRGRVDVIPHGIELKQFPPRDKSAARKKYAIRADATVLLSMARLCSASKMNYDHLLRFFSQLTRQTETPLLLVIAGADSGHGAQELSRLAHERQVADQVKILANFNDDAKPDILSCADLFLSLSDNLQESFGISVIEAMAAGLPVLCTDWDGHKDIVEDGITGYRISTTWKPTRCREDILAHFAHPYDHTVLQRMSREIHLDTQQLTTRALELIQGRERRTEMGRNARAKAQASYSVKTEIARFLALWQELGEIARRDQTEYADLFSLLTYNYPRHFHRYPSRFEPGEQEFAPSRLPPQDPSDEFGKDKP